MNKLFLLLLVFPFVFSSCSSDDEDSLNGTTWEAYEVEGTHTFKCTMKFHKSTFNSSGYEKDSRDEEEFAGSGTYTYDHPNIIFTEDGETYTRIISGKKMTIDDIVYTRK